MPFALAVPVEEARPQIDPRVVHFGQCKERRDVRYFELRDGPGKPVGIQKFIGRRPIAAFGNSDGDLQMLQYTAAGNGARCMLIVRHTDAEREFAYDRKSPIGKLDKALDEANVRGWTVVDMKKDWKTIFPFSAEQTGR
jgi:hypothetical protein